MKTIKSKLNLILVAFCLLFVFPYASLFSSPVVVQAAVVESVAAVKSKKEIRAKAKFQKKFKRLGEKLKKFSDPDKSKKKGKTLIFVGLGFLIVGIIVGSAATSGSLGCLGLLLAYPLGVALGVGGLITMIIGFVQAA